MAGMLVYTIYQPNGKGGKVRACGKGSYYGDYLNEKDAENARLKLKHANICWIECSMVMG